MSRPVARPAGLAPIDLLPQRVGRFTAMTARRTTAPNLFVSRVS